MKSLILAGFFILFCLVATTVALRTFTVNARAAFMTNLFLASLPFFIVVHLSTPADLKVIPAAFVEAHRFIDLAFGLLVYLAGYFGGLLQVYNLADRGLSLRMLIDIDELPKKAMDVPSIMASYGGGKGLGWMYEKRLSGMLRHGLIEMQGDSILLTARGLRLARFFASLRRFLRLAA